MRHFTRHIRWFFSPLLAAGTFLLAAAIISGAVAGVAPLPATARVAIYWTPFDSVRLAAADALAVAQADADRACCRRYLSLHNIPAADRAAYAKACSFLLNSLSRRRTIVIPGFLPDSDETAIAFFLDDYGIDPRAWNKLAEEGSGPAKSAQPEPYFQARFVEIVDGYDEYGIRDIYGVWHTTERRPNGKKTRKIKLGPAPWLLTDGGAAWNSLTKATGTAHPILRADWFLAFASWAPRYYDFLGLGNNIGDFRRLVFSDSKQAAKARTQTKGVVTFSGVALHNRTLTREPTVGLAVGGYYWESHDTETSVEGRDYVNVLLDEEFDATEVIASLRNGLQAYFLTDANGKRLDVAAAGIAQDHETGLQDHQVYCGRNCMTCHAKGIRPINDEVRGLADMRQHLSLLVAGGGKKERLRARRIQDLYFADDLSQIVGFDQVVFESAVGKATGLSALKNMNFFRRAIGDYLDRPVVPEMMADEVGLPLEELDAILKRAIGIDHTLVGAIPRPPRPARRDQFEQSYAQIQGLVLSSKVGEKKP